MATPCSSSDSPTKKQPLFIHADYITRSPDNKVITIHINITTDQLSAQITHEIEHNGNTNCAICYNEDSTIHIGDLQQYITTKGYNTKYTFWQDNHSAVYTNKIKWRPIDTTPPPPPRPNKEAC